MGSVSSWLATYANGNTRGAFKAGVKHFLASIYGEGGDLEDLEALGDRYIEECRGGRDWFKDLLSFAASLHGRPPKSARVFISAVKSWLGYALDVELTRRQGRLLLGRLPKGTRARTEEGELTGEAIRKILAHMDVKGRALVLFLASSGIRIGEALKLRLEDVDLETGLVNVRGEYTKGGDAYFTFISGEAREALQEWLKVREAYLEASINKGRGLNRIKARQDPRVFPFGMSVAQHMWLNAVRKAGLAERDGHTNRYKMHIHMLRKFFRTQLGLAGVDRDIIEALMGHSGYLDEAYRRYTRQQLAQIYSRAESSLTINTPRDIEEIRTGFRREIDELRAKVMDLTIKLTDANTIAMKFMEENMKLKERMKRAEEKLSQVERKIRELIGGEEENEGNHEGPELLENENF